MKKNTILLLVLFFCVMSFAQVGIGTNIPQASSILELKAADKALLLSRVATTAAVTTPVNGMMVYDISTNCIKGYQNGAWTGCLSACGNTTTKPTFGERTPCDALIDSRDFDFHHLNTFNGQGQSPMFISKDGYIYGGWGNDDAGWTGLGDVSSGGTAIPTNGDAPTTYAFSSTYLHTAFPAANILKYLPNETFKQIEHIRALMSLAISDSGKLYTWGMPFGQASLPASGKNVTYNNRTQSEIPFEIVNPNGAKWKHMYIASYSIVDVVYACDEAGDWWSWGSGLGGNVMFGTTPVSITATANRLTPTLMNALVPKPKCQEGSGVGNIEYSTSRSMAYIGVDDKAYVLGNDMPIIGGNSDSGPLLTTPQVVIFPVGVTPKKILMGRSRIYSTIFLGSDGKLYRIGAVETSTYGGATGRTAILIPNLSAYSFKDFTVESIGNSEQYIYGITTAGALVNITLTQPLASSPNFNVVASTVAGTENMNISTVWHEGDSGGFLVLKSDTNKHNYFYSRSGSTTWSRLAVGYTPQTNTQDSATSPVISVNGPIKMINCVD